MSDLIERQAAIDAIERRLAEPAYQHTGEDWYVGMNSAESELYDLPSAQPEPHYDEWCHDCKEYDKERHCCPRWNRVIRQALKDAQPEIIRCGECMHKDKKIDYCHYLGITICERDYCSYGERKTDERIQRI